MSKDCPSILVVDDDIDIAESMADILSDIGYRADTAHDGASAIKLIRQSKYDVALLDFKMPDMDGATLLEKIKSIQTDLTAIMITAYVGNDGIARARDAGTWRVLRKPVDVAELLGFIEQALRLRAILIVDDDVDFCESLSDILRGRDYRVGMAHDIASARDCLESQHFDAVLLDLRLGKHTAADVIDVLDSLARTILITGFRGEMNEIIEDLLQKGATTVYNKPLDVNELLAKLHELSTI